MAMHPIFNANRSLLAVAVLWGVLCLLVTALIGWVLTNGHYDDLIASLFLLAFPWYFLLLFFCSSNLYICTRYPLDSSPLKDLVRAQCIAALGSVGLWLLLGWGWAELLNELGLNDVDNIFEHTLVLHLLLGLVLYGVWILVHYAFLIARNSEHLSAEALQQKLLISEIELQAVKATVHPHFMYNSLTMLANLSLIAPQKIHSICVQMSDFLRYSVNYAKKEQVTLGDEVNHIKNYLSVERERYGEHLTVNFNIDDNVLPLACMPLLLFPLVENSIKHGIGSNFENGFINITIQLQNNTIDIDISNSVDSQARPPQSTGIGLSSLKKRLGSFYGPAARIKIAKTPIKDMALESEQSVYSVNLRLPAINLINDKQNS